MEAAGDDLYWLRIRCNATRSPPRPPPVKRLHAAMSQKSSLSLAVRQILLFFQWCVLISLSQRHQIHTKHFQRVTSCPILSARHARDMRRHRPW